MTWKFDKKCMLISAIAFALVLTICVLIPTVFTSRASKTTVSMITTNRITTSASRTTSTTVTSRTTTTTTATTATTATTTTERPFITLTHSDDTIVAIYSTKAGQSVNGVDGEYPSGEGPLNAIDDDIATKYLNFGGPSCSGCIQTTEGIDTGFIVIPAISNATIARAVIFATANDFEARDPLSVTLEGSAASDSSSLALGSSWTLIYTGSSGIDADPGRLVYGNRQSFPNTTPYRSYRLLVTARRGSASSVQYAECHILGYVAS